MELSQKKQEKITGMIESINHIIESVLNLEETYKEALEKVHPKYKQSAINLIHYRALRKHDSNELQKNLGNMGLSRMAKNQGHVMESLQSNHAILTAYLNGNFQKKRANLSVKKSKRIQKTNSKTLLGYRSKGRRTRIMVTIPSEAADNYQMVENMIACGMNCARINCAHDDKEAWLKMIENVRKASKKLNKNCKIAMDLGGPKIRTGQLVPGPKVMKLRPQKDVRGKILQPLKIWIGPVKSDEEIPHLPISKEDFKKIKQQHSLFFKDARKKKREIIISEIKKNGCYGLCQKTTFLETGIKMFLTPTKDGESVTVGELPMLEIPIQLHIGDNLRIDRQSILGESAKLDKEGKKMVSEAHIYCTAPEIIDQVKVGEPILFDDGKIKGIITEIDPEEVIVKIAHTVTKGGKLRSDKGINLPSTTLTISGLTEKDKKDLEFVTKYADVVNMSFVNNVEDVKGLLKELKKNSPKEDFGVILKIETQSGFNNLFEILLEAMQVYPVGVMIARGDLAIEAGWLNIGIVQEEILSICQAAHITDVWATQVLESLAKNGIPSRAEITDVIKAQQADCVMLNKGPYILNAIQFLDRILKQMEPYREKNTPFTPKIVKANPTKK